MSDIEKQVRDCVLKLASQKKEITYKEICEELKLESEDILEDHISTLILDGSLNVKLDQVNKRIISRMNPFARCLLSFFTLQFVFYLS